MRRFLKAGLWVFGGIMLGRLLGLVRDMFVSSVYGPTVDGEIAVLVITIPDTLINILVGGAMGAALIPEFKRRTPEESWGLFRQSWAWVFGLFLAVSFLFAACSEPLTRLLLPGLPEDAVGRAASLVRVSVWAIPLTAGAAVLRARLQSADRFAIPSLAGFIFNLYVVGALALFQGVPGLWAVAVAAVLGAGTSLLIQWLDVRRLKPSEGWSGGALVDRELAVRYFQALGAGSAILALPLVLRAFASSTGVGGQTIVYLAGKLVELPMGAVLSVISVAMFPAIAEAIGFEQRREEGLSLLRQGLNVILALALPIALGLGFFGIDWSEVLYGRGSTSTEDAQVIGRISSLMMIGLVPQAVNTLFLSTFHALKDMRRPFLVSLGALAIFLGFGFALAGELSLELLAWMYVGLHGSVTIVLGWILTRTHNVRFAGQVFGGRFLVRSGVTTGVFFTLCWVIAPMTSGALARVGLSIVLGFIAGVAGLAVDSSTRSRLVGVIRSRANKNSQ